jgi:hypothetical protein
MSQTTPLARAEDAKGAPLYDWFVLVVVLALETQDQTRTRTRTTTSEIPRFKQLHRTLERRAASIPTQ